MVEGRENLRPSLEPGEAVRIGREGFWQDLQRDLPVELRIGDLIDLSHAAFAAEGRHVVVAEAGADIEGHVPASVSTRSRAWATAR